MIQNPWANISQRARRATSLEMTRFHSEDYVEFLRLINPQNMDQANHALDRYNFGDDCPVFEGLWDFCGISAGGSMEGAARLNRQKCEVAVNWAGGLHHAKKNYASGFCYINGKFSHLVPSPFTIFANLAPYQ